ncbi:hypothetical protein Q3G72_005759 [Acer saccharum]|nr:hypothetical protein Q3G72_005759 [Acer saccharum]
MGRAVSGSRIWNPVLATGELAGAGDMCMCGDGDGTVAYTMRLLYQVDGFIGEGLERHLVIVKCLGILQETKRLNKPALVIPVN